jgi:hypothetical protein
VAAAAGLGFVNRAAHEAAWAPGLMCAAAGLLAAWSAMRAAAGKSPPSGAAATAAALGALVVSSTYLESRTLWEGGAWLAAVAAGATLTLEIVAAIRGKDLRAPAAAGMAALGAGMLLARFSAGGAALAALASALPGVLLLLEGRLATESGRPGTGEVEVAYD